MLLRINPPQSKGTGPMDAAFWHGTGGRKAMAYGHLIAISFSRHTSTETKHFHPIFCVLPDSSQQHMFAKAELRCSDACQLSFGVPFFLGNVLQKLFTGFGRSSEAGKLVNHFLDVCFAHSIFPPIVQQLVHLKRCQKRIVVPGRALTCPEHILFCSNPHYFLFPSFSFSRDGIGHGVRGGSSRNQWLVGTGSIVPRSNIPRFTLIPGIIAPLIRTGLPWMFTP